MTAPVYHIVFNDGFWRIEFDGLYLGEFVTAREAGEIALRIANSRLSASPNIRMVTAPSGEITVGDLGDSA
jgi:hypothetical protein